MEKLRNNRQLQLIVGGTLAIICGLAFYFLYWTKTPEYSLGIIRDAVKNHDIVQFQQHVDLDTLINKGFDSFMAAEVKNNKDLSSPLAQGMIAMLKPQVVETFKKEILDTVGGNSSGDRANTSKGGAESRAKRGNELVKNIDPLKNMSANGVKKVSTINNNGTTAIVSIIVHDKQVNKDYDFHLQMNKLGNGEWQVKELVNLGEVLTQKETDQAEKLKELDAPIKKQIYSTLKTTGNASIRRGIVDTRLELDIGLQNTGEKDIVGAKGRMILFDAGNKNNVFKEVQLKDWGAVAKDRNTVVTTIVSLNSFEDNDAEIEKRGLSGRMNTIGYRLEIMELDFADGTKLVRPTKLPAAE